MKKMLRYFLALGVIFSLVAARTTQAAPTKMSTQKACCVSFTAD